MDARIDELTSRLQREKHLSRKDKITVAHLQHEISRQKALTQVRKNPWQVKTSMVLSTGMIRQNLIGS